MRQVLPAAVPLAALLLAACGGESRLRAEAAAGAGPLVDEFLGALEAGRVDQALARTTPAFRASAGREAVAEVSRSMVQVLGAVRARGEPEVSAVRPLPGSDPPVAGIASISWPTQFAKGEAKVAARVERGTDGAWRVDAFAVEGALFTWILRK
ncbi:MAG: hypothetical protein HMLKMBBP_02698 [Planctomycetes bacterium]|nr:hypothetical protein [Planctomycetota bacterium]